VVDGHVLPSAFNKNDLINMDRRVSVDREDCLDRNVVVDRAREQKLKADPAKNILRETGLVAVWCRSFDR
jgi:hypothetical protein